MKNIKDFKLYLESLNSNEISGLSEVISLINENTTYGWKGQELEETYECVILEDVDNSYDDNEEIIEEIITYNGWYEKLLQISKDNDEIKDVIELIRSCEEYLWQNNLEYTFHCILIESISSSDFNLDYNGWYERLEELSK